MGFWEWLFGTEEKTENKRKRVFISFAIEDEEYRNFLNEQARKKRSPFDFIDMSVKKPWKENEWKKRCRTKIKKCDCMIVLLSKKTWHSSGVRYEVRCAKETGIPIRGMNIRKKEQITLPPELKGIEVMGWSWGNLETYLN